MEDKARPGARTKAPIESRTADPAAREMLVEAQATGQLTAWDRYQAQQPQCGFGLSGVCCRICIQGPCRLVPKKEAQAKGICGAADYTIVARNVARMVAGGASSHADHGRHVAHTLLRVAEGKAKDYRIADPVKLRQVAARIGLAPDGKDDLTLARELAEKALEDYGRAGDEPCTWLQTTITEGRRSKFQNCDITPTAIDRAIVQILHQTAMGMDADPVNTIFGALKTALADYTGMHIATDIHDILFGTPQPVVSEANLGVLDQAHVNIATHGHNPTLSQMVVAAARELKGEAEAIGAKGVNVVGICCTGNELLMREGVYLAANSSAQELAIMTGVVDAVIVDIQCIMPSLRSLCECYHTELITTSAEAKIPGARHLPLDEARALESAKEMVRLAIAAYQRRLPEKVRLSGHKSQVVAGFSLEAILAILGKVDSTRPVKVLTDAIEAGELRGVCLFAGCNNQKQPHDEAHLTIARELARNDVLLLATGCAAGAFAKAGLCSPQAVETYAGEGLRRFLGRLQEAAGIEPGLPLVFHMGSCVDNTRAEDLCTAMAVELDVDTPKVPFVASAPEAMHEKAVSIGCGAIALGIPTHVGVMPFIEGSPLVYGVATQIAHDVYGGYFIFETDPAEGARKLLEALDYRTWKLRIHRQAAQKLGTGLAAGY